MEKILCVYATRQIDSNLMMASTVFRGLNEAGYAADMIFLGSSDVIAEFRKRYEQYFNNIFYKQISPPLKSNKIYRCNPLLYTYIRSFVLDGIFSPGVLWLKKLLNSSYDKILSFVPPVISGLYALKIKKAFNKNIPLIQFWTDPLSLGRCNYISEIPKSRILHKCLEHRILMGGGKQNSFLSPSFDGNGSEIAS